MNGYLVPPVWLTPPLGRLRRFSTPARRSATPPRKTDALFDYLLRGGPKPELCMNQPSCGWFTLQQLGGPGLFDWMRVCPDCGYWWRSRL